LLAAIEQLRSRGTTVLWFTSIPATELSAGTESLIWWHLVDGQFRKLERGSES